MRAPEHSLISSRATSRTSRMKTSHRGPTWSNSSTRPQTLAGKAGVSKEIRDRIQNHALQDVSSKSYDRWTYMPEKRAAMAKWDRFVQQLLAKKDHHAYAAENAPVTNDTFGGGMASV